MATGTSSPTSRARPTRSAASGAWWVVEEGELRGNAGISRNASDQRPVMLNDVLAVCIGAAVVVVFATIFGVVELLWRGLHAVRRVSGL